MGAGGVTPHLGGLAAITAALLAGQLPGTVRDRPTPAQGGAAAVSPAHPRTGAAPLAGLDPAAPVPTAAGVRTAVGALLGAPLLNGGAGGPAATVVDAATGRTLYDTRGAQGGGPASTLKIATATAALHALGPDTRLRTRVVRRGDTIWLVGAGDPTLTAATGRGGYPQPARLADLAAAVRKAGVTGVTRVLGDGSLFTGPTTANGWKDGYVTGGNVTPVSGLEVDAGRPTPTSAGARSATPVQAAADAFAAALRRAGVRVGATGTGTADRLATEVAYVDSPPVSDLVERMLTLSDNDQAESFGRLVAIRTGRPATFTGAVAAVSAQLSALGIPTAGSSLADSSGLSPLDRIAPRTLVAALRAAALPAHADLRSLLTGLPVAGFTGTLAGRYRAPGTRQAGGTVRAKTGSLSTVTSEAGLVVDADGRLLIFAFLAPVGVSDAGETALDRAATALAGCGCGG